MQQKPTYLQRISLKNKTPEEAERIRKLFDENIDLANKAAKKYYSTPYWEFDEAIQIARMGLWKACLIWDPNKYRLSTLAYNIINRDFMDFDREQKRQPDILFNLEDNVVTEDLSLNDVLVDENADTEGEFIEKSEIEELNNDILYILDDISDDLNIPKSIVKIVYLAYIESQKEKQINLRDLTFVKKSQIKQIMSELQIRLSEIL